MKTASPMVYVSADALVVPSDHPDHFLEAGIAPYAAGFMNWCCGTYRTVLLCDWPLAQATYLVDKLGVPPQSLPIRTYYGSKVDSLNLDSNFFLIDDALIPGEVSWFLEHGLQSRIIGVNPYVGVSLETRRALQERTHG